MTRAGTVHRGVCARLAAMFGVMVAVAGCQTEAPQEMAFSLTSYQSSPALVAAVLVGERSAIPLPTVVFGMADTGEVRSTSTERLRWDGASGSVQVKAQWIEMLTNRAYEAQTTVKVADLFHSQPDVVDLTLIIGPNGLMLIGSDPLPTEGPPRDVARVCGTRVPAQDRAIAAEANDHAKLTEALALTYPPVPPDSECPEPAP